MSKSREVPPEHMALAWHIMLERTRYKGRNFKSSMKRAFAAIEEKCNTDQSEHKQVRKDIETLRKEFNLE